MIHCLEHRSPVKTQTKTREQPTCQIGGELGVWVATKEPLQLVQAEGRRASSAPTNRYVETVGVQLKEVLSMYVAPIHKAHPTQHAGLQPHRYGGKKGWQL